MRLPAFLVIVCFSSLFLTAGCDSPVAEEGSDYPQFPLPVNEKIRELRNCCDNLFNEGPPEFGIGSFFLNEWQPGEIFTILELRRLDVTLYGTAVYTEREKFYDIDPDGARPATFLSKSPKENLLYIVITNEYSRSIGELRALDLSTPHTPKELPPLVRDSTYNISSIRIRELSDGSLLKVYYSYGNEDTGLEPGYYRLSETGPPDELLLAHSNPDGPSEAINGFDLSPDGSTLLYPIHPDLVPGPAAYGGPRPELATLHLETGTRETLPVQFNVQQFLWARYHPGGEQIVVSNYPRNILGFTSVDIDSMYIVDLNTYRRRPLDTRTWRLYYTADVFPSWSPDGNLLIYGSAKVFPSDFSLGRYSVFTLDLTEQEK